MNDIRVRFAPSPTGFLHIGGVRTALFSWLFARRHKGVFILRIEDTDEVRSTAESVNAIIESMRWIGLDWDEGPDRYEGEGRYTGRGEYGPYFQMERKELYRKHIERLLAEDRAYRCYCTKEELDEMRRRAQQEKKRPLYDRRCRDLTPARRAELEAAGRKWSVRLKMPQDGTTVVSDLIRGSVSFDNSLQQDFVIQKTAGGPTYNFACVVDDHEMKMSHVIRGDEHLSNTPSQVQLYAALGWEPPRFAHLSTILGPDGGKLSKRHGATSVTEYRDQGYLPEALRNYLALLGWSTPDSQQLFSPEELIAKFDLDGCQKNPATFDPVKLQWMNGEYIRGKSNEGLFAAVKPFLDRAGLEAADPEKLLTAVVMEQEKCKLLTDIPGRVDIFFKDVEYQEKAVDQVLRKAGVAEILEGLSKLISGLEPYTEQALEGGIRAFCKEQDLKTGKVFHPLRVAVSGRTEGPTLFGMLELLGKKLVLKRLGDACRLIAPASSAS
ncbi:MAG: glutamate--tRNA ligase [Elusimicrobiota bacterium]